MADIPQQAWIVFSGLGGALIGGLITLFVTFLQNFSASNRFKTQLAHEKEIQSEEREMSLRREIYYGAVDSIAAAIKFLSSIVDINIQEFSQNNSPDLTAKHYKVQLIAGEKVLNAFFDCTNLITQSIFSLMPQKLAIQGLEIEKDGNEQIQKSAFEAHKAITLKMEELNKQKNYDEIIWAPLKQASEEYMADINLCIQNGLELSQKIGLAKIQLTKDMVPLLQEINISAGNVIFFMRKELVLKEKDEIFIVLEKLLKESNDKNQIIFTKFISDIAVLLEKEL